jgi:hypothetical protein
LAVKCKKTFLDIAYDFPVIVMDRGGSFEKNYLRSVKVIFFMWAHPTHDDYEKTIGEIEKRFFAFNCQLKELNREILLS